MLCYILRHERYKHEIKPVWLSGKDEETNNWFSRTEVVNIIARDTGLNAHNVLWFIMQDVSHLRYFWQKNTVSCIAMKKKGLPPFEIYENEYSNTAAEFKPQPPGPEWTTM